ncbi:MAG: 16S rRNA (guanine(527)-N(7))-methyltransferase RsmG [Methylococcales bacterium]|nr:MAG: 16S rRNA (guanine(527)-N(7))-methyltransferase RsmG [Methylococcales bacterium]
MDDCRKILVSGLEALNQELTEHQIEQLLTYIALIEKWNKSYNLTSIRDKVSMVPMHLLDSLAIVPFITGKRVIDIGTGAGLPGIVLAVCFPDIEFVLLDSNAKKTRFVQQAILELKLKNVSICHNRVELYRPEHNFDIAITRAFASLEDIMRLTTHLLNNEGVLLAMKGQIPDVSMLEVAKTELYPLSVPGIEGERCLVKIHLNNVAEVS